MADQPYLSGTYRTGLLAPLRVVSLVPAISKSLAELALADRVVGVTDDAIFPDGGFPWAGRLGPSESPDIERVLALEPEVVLLGTQHEREMRLLQAGGVPVWLADPHTVREAFNLLWDLMNALEGPQMVARVRAMEWTCDWLERLAETRVAPARVLALTGRDPLTSVGSSSYTHDLLRVCGGENVFGARGERSLEVTVPELTDVQPDVILLAAGGANGFSPDDLAAVFALDTPAGRAGRVTLVDGTLLTWAGTRVARAFDALPPFLEIGDSARI